MKTPLFLPLQITQADKWREYLNPLRWLTTGMVAGWLQEQQLGTVSNIAWYYRFIERRDPLLSVLVDRRTTAIEKLAWSVKTLPDEQVEALGCTHAQAKAQQAELRQRYNNIDNMREAISFLALASFRGYSHLEKHYDGDGNEKHLEPVPQWNWARAGLFGEWFYNQGAFPVFGAAPGQGALNPNLTVIEPGNFLVREVERPIDEALAFEFPRRGMCEKDWDAWIETFGIPPIFIELPPDMPLEKQDDYQKVVEEIIANVRGTLPHGAEVHTVEASTGADPFEKRVRYIDERYVTKATGGTLTTLAQSGSGTLAGGAHQDSFDGLAQAEARLISEIFNNQFDKPVLEEKFETLPRLAFFEIAPIETSDPGAVVDHVSKLASAGYEVDTDQLEDLSGYQVTLRTPVDATDVTADKGNPSAKGEPNEPTPNRAAFDAILNRVDERQLAELMRTLGEHIDDESDGSWAPIVNRVRELFDSPDAEFFANAKKLVADVPELLKPTDLDEKAIAGWQNSLSACLLNGLTDEPKPKPGKRARKRQKAVAP